MEQDKVSTEIKGGKFKYSIHRLSAGRSESSQMGWNLCNARKSSLYPLLQVSSASFGTSAQPTPASMEAYVWPHTPRSSAAAHLALRVMPANMMSMSASRTLDSALKAPPAIIPWAPTNVSALQGGKVHTVSSEQDPAPWQAVQMGAPASWCQGETPPFTSASARQASQA